MTSYNGKRVSWKRLSGATITGIVVGEDENHLYVKNDKHASDRDYDFTISKKQMAEMPQLFTFE